MSTTHWIWSYGARELATTRKKRSPPSISNVMCYGPWWTPSNAHFPAKLVQTTKKRRARRFLLFFVLFVSSWFKHHLELMNDRADNGFVQAKDFAKSAASI